MSNGPEGQKKEQTRPYGTLFCGPGAGRGSLRTAVQQGNADGGCVRVRKKGLSPKRKPLNLLERETGFEPATSTLARLHSTTELLPHTGTVFCDRFLWRRHPDLNWRMEVLQTSALPLGYVALCCGAGNGI